MVRTSQYYDYLLSIDQKATLFCAYKQSLLKLFAGALTSLLTDIGSNVLDWPLEVRNSPMRSGGEFSDNSGNRRNVD